MKNTIFPLVAFMFLFTTVLSSQGDSTVVVTKLIERSSFPNLVRYVKDIDGDGFDDLIGKADDRLVIQYGIGAAGKWTHPIYPLDFAVAGYELIDLDSDGDLDIIGIAKLEYNDINSIYAFYNDDGSDSFSPVLLKECPDLRMSFFTSRMNKVSFDERELLIFNCSRASSGHSIIAAYDIEENEIVDLYESSGTRVLPYIYVVENSLLGKGIVFGLAESAPSNDDPHPKIDVLWLGLNEQGSAAEIYSIAQNVGYHFHVRDAQGDGNADIFLQDADLSAIYWQPIDDFFNNPPKAYMIKGAELWDHFIPLHANNDDQIDLWYSYSHPTFNDRYGGFRLQLTDSIIGDCIVADTFYEPEIYDHIRYSDLIHPQVYDINQNGIEEFPNSFQGDRYWTHSYLELINDSLQGFSNDPLLEMWNPLPVFADGSGQKQAFYMANSSSSKGAMIYKVTEMEQPGRYQVEPFFEYHPNVPAEVYRHDGINHVFAVQSANGIYNDLIFRVHGNYSLDSTQNDILEGYHRIKVDVQGNSSAPEFVNPILGLVEYLDFFGTGEEVAMVIHKGVTVFRDDDQNYIAEETLLNISFLGDGDIDIDAFGDLNGDNRIDLVKDSTIYFQRDNGEFEEQSLSFRYFGNGNPIIEDLNEDGLNDLFYKGTRSSTFLNLGNEEFQYLPIWSAYSIYDDHLEYHYLDIDGDEDKELIFLYGDYIEVMENPLDSCFSGELECPGTSTIIYGPSVNGYPRGGNGIYSSIQTDLTGNNDPVTLIFNGCLFYLGNPIQDEPDSPEETIRDSITSTTAFAYPNPVSNQLNIHCPDCSNVSATLRIFNQSGELIRSFVPREISDGWPVNDLASGFYFFALIQEGEIVAAGNFVK